VHKAVLHSAEGLAAAERRRTFPPRRLELGGTRRTPSTEPRGASEVIMLPSRATRA
jgi:hypothetical protein